MARFIVWLWLVFLPGVALAQDDVLDAAPIDIAAVAIPERDPSERIEVDAADAADTIETDEAGGGLDLAAPWPSLLDTRRAIRALRRQIDAEYDHTGGHLVIAGGLCLGLGLVGSGIAIAPLGGGWNILNPDPPLIVVASASLAVTVLAFVLTIAGMLTDDAENARWQPQRERIDRLEDRAARIERRAAELTLSASGVGVRF